MRVATCFAIYITLYIPAPIRVKRLPACVCHPSSLNADRGLSAPPAER